MSKTLTVVLMVMFYVQIHLGSSDKNWGLIELFNEVRSHKTPIVVERIVTLMKLFSIVRFPSWQQTVAGEREVLKSLAEDATEIPVASRTRDDRCLCLRQAVLLRIDVKLIR